MRVEPYLFYNGRCEEAIEFYKRAIGAKDVMLMRFKEAPPGEGPPLSPGTENKIMHASLRIGEATVMMSDGQCTGQPDFKGFSLSLDATDEADAKRLFNALADGGTVHMPLTKTFFSPSFGMVGDRFGASWMIIVNVSH